LRPCPEVPQRKQLFFPTLDSKPLRLLSLIVSFSRAGATFCCPVNPLPDTKNRISLLALEISRHFFFGEKSCLPNGCLFHVFGGLIRICREESHPYFTFLFFPPAVGRAGNYSSLIVWTFLSFCWRGEASTRPASSPLLNKALTKKLIDSQDTILDLLFPPRRITTGQLCYGGLCLPHSVGDSSLTSGCSVASRS